MSRTLEWRSPSAPTAAPAALLEGAAMVRDLSALWGAWLWHARALATPAMLPPASSPPAVGTESTLRGATANVQTLLPRQATRSYARNSSALLLSKVTILEQRFHGAALDVIGIQEGRSAETAERPGTFYRMFMSAADSGGQHGVQCWVRRSSEHTIVQWRAVSPLMMYVVLRWSTGHLVIALVGHAPPECSSEATKETFWPILWHTTAELLQRYPSAFWLHALDANARVGSVRSTAIGRHHPERENDNGSRLRTYAEHFGFIVISTFFPEVGPTWTSPKGPRYRLDHLLCRADHRTQAVRCWVAEDIDLTMNATPDHTLVAGDFEVGDAEPTAEKLGDTFRLDKRALVDSEACEAFRAALWRYEPPSGVTIDEHLADANEYLRRSASRCFQMVRDAPRKPWIAPDTWAHIRQIAPMRRQIAAAAGESRRAFQGAVFCVWRGLVARSPPAGGSMRSALTSPWRWIGQAIDLGRRSAEFSWWAARWHAAIFAVQLDARPLLARDRAEFLDSMALKAAAAMQRNDLKTAFGVARSLGAAKTIQNTSVYKLDGSLTTSPEEESARWDEHFAAVFQGELVSRDQLRCKAELSPPPVSLDTGVERTAAAFEALGKNKGVGPDGIPAELLQAGGAPCAVMYADINCRVAATLQWPVEWCGGDLVHVWKRKGDPAVCDDSRGLLLADHAAKGLASIAKEDMDDLYTRHVPSHQCGAVAGRGTDFATHIVRSLLAIAESLGYSVFALFVDLVKAFDKIVRELVMGWGSRPSDERVPYLVALGVDPAAAAWIVDYVETNGCVFEQWGVSPTTLGMLRTLHEHAWFQVRGSSQAIRSKTGGRQGCKVGSHVFNAGYCVALGLLDTQLAARGLAFRVVEPGGPFWQTPCGEGADGRPVIAATFVDDLGIARLPVHLDAAIAQLMTILTTTFGQCHLAINWSKGKTECLLKYRGTGATFAREARRREDGELAIWVPEVDKWLLVMDVYCHLGSMLSAAGEAFANVRRRTQMAMTAYTPIAFKVFGSSLIPDRHKLSFLKSLVLSRLLFGLHIACLPVAHLRRLNAVYMRGLRRIAGDCRFGPAVQWSDREVRERLNVPSIDCLLMVMRLRYLQRLVLLRPPDLVAVLHFRLKGQPLPWVRLLAADCEFLRCEGLVPPAVPSFLDAPLQWAALVADRKKWATAVGSVHFFDSCLDREGVTSLRTPLTVKCRMCSARFASARARASHERIAHRVTTKAKNYLHSTACPCCKVDFRQKIRLLAHWSDSRRPRCWAWVQAHSAPLTSGQQTKVDEELRAARRAGQRAGRTHALCHLPARRADGRTIGRLG